MMATNSQKIENTQGQNIGMETVSYFVDAMQRSVLFLDILRKRGNIYLEHLEKGQPPVLTFDYEIIMKGADLNPASNYNLAQIKPPKKYKIDPTLRPVIIVDPRAGHGPGIGGSKRASEIGMALKAGHPVYFILFETDPIPGQTIGDVEKCEIYFIEEVVRRHPKARKPSVTGNCQAGWALAMLSADKPGTTGPVVLNGSPLSYWAGLEGKDTMRYLGGLYGGVWINSLISDLGNGIFDGANLVLNFERLNPTNTYWSKQYNVYANVDTEADRYLNFERWWNGFFNLTKDEICFIVENLFVGNKLEQGRLSLDNEKMLDLKNIQDPIVVFCSDGDNITPPLQALNWIVHTWESTEEIRRHQQVIVYMTHKNIGHLGIFVSGKVAKKEHKEIISSYDMIEYLPPGLYEMVIEADPDAKGVEEFDVRFVEREIEDILLLDDGMKEEEEQFPLVAEISRHNNELYHTYISPWIQALTNSHTAEMNKQLHSLRISRYGFSDLNPFLWWPQIAAPEVAKNRMPVDENNYLLGWERTTSKIIETCLDTYQDFAANWTEMMFKSVYSASSPLNWFFPDARPKPLSPKEVVAQRREKAVQMEEDRGKWLAKMTEGGFLEALVRIIIAIGAADRVLEREEFINIQVLSKKHKRLKNIEISDFRRIARDQARILQIDLKKAIRSLAKLLPNKKDRDDVMEICLAVFKDNNITEETKKLINTLTHGKMEMDLQDTKG